MLSCIPALNTCHRAQVLPFFESMGFKCPPRKGVADFLQEVTSRVDQAQYWCATEAASG